MNLLKMLKIRYTIVYSFYRQLFGKKKRGGDCKVKITSSSVFFWRVIGKKSQLRPVVTKLFYRMGKRDYFETKCLLTLWDITEKADSDS